MTIKRTTADWRTISRFTVGFYNLNFDFVNELLIKYKYFNDHLECGISYKIYENWHDFEIVFAKSNETLDSLIEKVMELPGCTCNHNNTIYKNLVCKRLGRSSVIKKEVKFPCCHSCGHSWSSFMIKYPFPELIVTARCNHKAQRVIFSGRYHAQVLTGVIHDATSLFFPRK